MAEEHISLGQVLARLVERGLLDQQGFGRISEHLSREQAAPDTPWYINLFVALGAWVAAAFSLPFVVFFLYLLFAQSEASEDAWFASIIVWGFVFIAAGTALRLLRERIFLSQLALALSAAGHAVALVGLGHSFHGLWPVMLASVLLCAVLYPLFRDPIHRFASTVLAMVMVTVWLFTADLEHGLHVLVLLEVVGSGFLFTSHMTPALRPLAYAFAVSLLGTLGIILMPEVDVGTPWWPSSAILALALVWLYQRLAGGVQGLRREPMVLAICVTLLLGVVSSPGILAAVWLLVLGYALGDRILLGLGSISLPAFMVMYYYGLDVSPLTRSGVLVTSGAVLLGARWYLGTRPWARKEAG